MIIWYNLPKNVQKLPGVQRQVLLQIPQVFLQRDFVESGQQPKASFQAGHTDNKVRLQQNQIPVKIWTLYLFTLLR